MKPASNIAGFLIFSLCLATIDLVMTYNCNMLIGNLKRFSLEHLILNGMNVRITMHNGFMEELNEMSFGVFCQQLLDNLQYLMVTD